MVSCSCKRHVLIFSNEVGTRAIPIIDRVNSLLKDKSISALTANEELPVGDVLVVRFI